jgi:hypothetical protein
VQAVSPPSRESRRSLCHRAERCRRSLGGAWLAQRGYVSELSVRVYAVFFFGSALVSAHGLIFSSVAARASSATSVSYAAWARNQ